MTDDKLPKSLPIDIYYHLEIMQVIRKSRELVIIWLEKLIEILEITGLPEDQLRKLGLI
jgi:hypothetical protein